MTKHEPTPLGEAMKAATDRLKIVPDGSGYSARPPDVTIDQVLLGAGVPKLLLDRTLDNYRPRRGTVAALSAVRNLVDPKTAHTLILCGPYGTGKSHLAAAVLHARADLWLERFPRFIVEETAEGIVARPPFASRYVHVARLLDEIRAAYNAPDRPDPIAGYMGAPLLVLDDFGRERTTDWVRERLDLLIDHRYGALLPTLVTSNHTPDELHERGYGAIVSRLLSIEHGGQLVTIEADDYRLSGGQA